MRRQRDIVSWIAAFFALAITLLVLTESSGWVGRPFPGFLLLGNRVVASAGLAHWPAVADSSIYQREVVAVEGRPLADARDLAQHVRRLPVGSEVRYELRSGDQNSSHPIATRRFSGLDYLLLFGSYFASGLSLVAAALAIRFLGRGPARSSAVPLYIVGLYALTAVDLYGPYRLFRLHAFLECLLFAAVLHFAAVFPFRRAWLVARPRLLALPYAVSAGFGVLMQLGLYDPSHYVTSHRVAIGAFGSALPVLVASQVWAHLRPIDFESRQRVKVLAAGAFLALLGPILLALASAMTGGSVPENLAGWTAILFPVAIAYAVLREDLLGVDAGLRRLTSYILVSALTAAAFAGAVSLTDLLLQETLGISRRAPAVLLSGLAVAALLPLRDRFQSSVDRLFFRTSVDFRRLLEEALQRLARVTDLDGIRAVIEDAVREALQPETLHLDVAPGHEPSAADDERLEDLPAGGLRVPFALDGRALARLTLGRRLSGRRYGAEERRLLRNLASQGALALAKALALEQLRELNETLEGKVQERTAELAATLTALRDTQRQMAHQEKMASLGQLVAGVAHEINNPLHFVEGNLQFLRQHVDSLCTAIVEYEKIAGEYAPALTERLAEARARLDLDWAVEDLPSLLAACAEGVERTATIVRDLRSFSRADGGRRSEIDLRTSLEATLNLLQGRLIGIEVEREYGETPTVECIEGQLDQVFMNLLANAADALGERGTIRVRTACNGPDRVIVEVEDDGPGIPPEARGRIFEPFFTTKEVGKGTGLGLALSYGIVTRHGGTLGVRSGPGRGTCFILDLPIRLPEDAPQAGSAPADRPAG